MHRRWSVTFVAAVLATAVPAATVPCAWAQPAGKPAEPAKNKKKAAKEYVDAGVAAHDAGDFDTALEFYAKAYELVPHPTLLFNMAQSQRLAGRLPEALELYRRFLAEKPKGPQAKTAREFVTSLEVQVAAEDARKAKAAAQAAADAEAERKAEELRQAEAAQAAEEARQADEARQAAAAAAPAPAPVAPEPLVEAPVDPGSEGRPLRLGGVAVAFVGVTLMAGGIGYGIEAGRIADDLKAGSPTVDGRTADDRDRAERDRSILLGVGAVVAAGGAWLYWMGHSRESRGVAIVPAWNQGPGLVVARGF